MNWMGAWARVRIYTVVDDREKWIEYKEMHGGEKQKSEEDEANHK